MDIFFNQFLSKMDDEFIEGVKFAEKQNAELQYGKVPDGVYKVEMYYMQVKQSRKGNWMIQATFRILDGQYEKQAVWAYFVIKQSNIEKNNKFLQSLGTDIKVECLSITQYKQLVDDIFITIKYEKEYDLEIKTSSTGFTNYKILNIYDKPYEPLPFLDD